MSASSPTLNGKVALVTGGSRGIGLAIAKALLAEGASVCLTARKPEGLVEATGDLAAGERLLTVAHNSGDAAHRADAVAQTIDRFGSLDVLVNSFASVLYDGREDEVAATYPLGRIGEPHDVASAVVFLASDEAAWITGQTLAVDGGILLNGGVDG